jgi:penicillin G amidase
MTRRLLGILLLLITATLIFVLSRSWGSVPAIGKLLSTSHGFWKNIDAHPEHSYAFQIQGPKGTVEVIYDERGIPHIFANNNEDLYYAQGFVMAKDRLWQMDFVSYVSSGRLSELVGEKALKMDRYHRRIGLRKAAENSLELLSKDPETSEAVNAFTDGVNAYIQKLSSSQYPIEYKLLGYKPEAWTPLKCALLLKYMANDLTGHDNDIEYSNALQLFGREAFELMYPDYIEPIDPIIPLETPFNFTPLKPKTVQKSDASELASLFPNPIKDFLPPVGLGSNNWAVSGSKTASGMPMLCNDPHLSLNLPSIWYEMQLVTPDMNVYGVTLPGSPGIVIGYNDRIAWGVTNAGMDVRDWYALELNPGNEKQYNAAGEWKNFEVIEEVYKVKGQPDFKENIKWTVIGPVVFEPDFTKTKDKAGLAMNWLAHRPTNELKTFISLNKAKNHQDYLAALDHFWCPAQNFVYADIENNVAIKEQGRFWIRHPEQGKFIQSLSDADLESIDRHFIPNAHNPYVLNPARGFVSSANQIPVGPQYPYYILGDYEHYRNRRINEVLSGLKDATPDDMKTLHYDNMSVIARENLPHWLSTVQRPANGTGRQIHQSLSKWNFMTDFESEASSYFYKWLEFIEDLAWDELKSDDISFTLPTQYVTVDLLKKHPNFPLFDFQKTDKRENANDIIRMAFDSTVAWFNDHSDQAEFRIYKNTALTHLAQLAPFSYQYMKIGGYINIVNATSSRWGASVRLLIDFADGRPQGYGMYPGGQSGNPGSAGYNSFVDAWTDGKYYKHNFFKTFKDAQISISK